MRRRLRLRQQLEMPRHPLQGSRPCEGQARSTRTTLREAMEVVVRVSSFCTLHCNICILTNKPLHEATSFNSSVRIEFPQLLELTPNLCVLGDFGFTQPIIDRMAEHFVHLSICVFEHLCSFCLYTRRSIETGDSIVSCVFSFSSYYFWLPFLTHTHTRPVPVCHNTNTLFGFP